MIYGYHRVSTKEQHLDRGIKEITDYCNNNGLELQKIYTDEMTGKTFDRPKYALLKDDVLRKGDILIVTEIDRLGRDKDSTLRELRHFKKRGIRVMILEIPTTLQDFSALNNNLATMMLDTINNLMIEMYANLAHAEMEKRKKRQREGILAMKARNEWTKYGRPRVITSEKFKKEYQKVIDGDLKPTELIRKLGMTNATYYRYRKDLLSSKK